MKKVAIGVDIGGTNTLVGAVTEQGEIVAQTTITTADYPVVDDFVDELGYEIMNLVKSTEYQIKAVGIGAPNGNYHNGSIESAVNLQWKGRVPLAALVEKKLDLPVVLTNDANAAALGEMKFGAAKGMKDFIILTLGTGLGSGIVIDGRVLYGHTGLAGEYGHVIMVPGGRDCGCGRQGCLETYVSATGIVRTVQWLLSESKEESALRKIHPAELTSRQISDAALKGDHIALEAFDYTAEMLAQAIANAAVFSSPEAIFLFGGLANAGDLLFEPLKKYVDEFMYSSMKDTVKIMPSGISECNAAVLGAAALAWGEYGS
ncbi:MAG TPA: ROK family protein [Bacteroidales bacterium]|nr:ROK family protein [Bacteroidales bacterium]